MAKKDDRRNSRPDEVRVKGHADFLHLETLDEKVDEMVENRNEIFIHNLEYILQQKNMTQAAMCEEKLGNTPLSPQITGYKKKGKDIPYRTIARIATAFEYTPEQMTGQLLDQAGGRGYAVDKIPSRPSDEYKKYYGTYHMAYFGNDAQLGNNKRSTARALRFGLLTVYPGNAVDGIPTLHVAAFTNCTDEERETLVNCTRNAESQGGGRAYRACYEKVATAHQGDNREMPRLKCFYEGELKLNERMAEITMRQVKGVDEVHIRLHNRAANSSEGSEYKGGLAAMLSNSRGEEHMPCVQSVILSKRGFAGVAKEELANRLFMESPQINIQDEIKSIVTYMKALYPSEETENPLSQLSEADKAFMLETYIEKKLTDVVKRNVVGYYKISTAMDSVIYKALCR